LREPESEPSVWEGFYCHIVLGKQAKGQTDGLLMSPDLVAALNRQWPFADEISAVIDRMRTRAADAGE
jgi:hypothetical protein